MDIEEQSLVYHVTLMWQTVSEISVFLCLERYLYTRLEIDERWGLPRWSLSGFVLEVTEMVSQSEHVKHQTQFEHEPVETKVAEKKVVRVIR